MRAPAAPKLGMGKKFGDSQDCADELDKLQMEAKALAARDYQESDWTLLKVASMNRIMALLMISHFVRSMTVK